MNALSVLELVVTPDSASGLLHTRLIDEEHWTWSTPVPLPDATVSFASVWAAAAP